MKRIIIFCLSLILLLACVPTPEEVFVVNKGDGVLTEKIAEKPVAEKPFEAPTRVDEVIEANDLTVELAAEVVLPEGGRYPVAEVMPKTYDAAWARDMLTRIADGKMLLVRESEAGANMTREGILREVEAVQNSLESFDELYGNLPESEQAEMRAQLNEALDVWSAYYREAPDSTDGLEADLSDTAYRALGRMSAEIDCTRPERAYHSPIEVYGTGLISFMNMDMTYGETKQRGPVTGPLPGVALTEAEAIEVAKTFLQKLGETGLEPVLVLDANGRRYGDDPRDEHAYAIWFTRPVGNMPGAMAHSQQDIYGVYSQNGGDRAYSEPCDQEYAYFLIRDSGVNWFDWAAPSAVTRIVNENVALVPFDTILETFRKQIVVEAFPALEEARVNAGLRDNMTITDTTLCIDRIALESVRIRKEGATGTFLLVPTWTFYGRLVLHGENLGDLRFAGWTIEENGDAVWYVPGGCYLQINAIDGSVLNPALGY